MKAVLAAVATALVWGLWCVAEGKAAKLQDIYPASLLLSVAGLVTCLVEIPVFWFLSKRSQALILLNAQSIKWSLITMASLSIASVPYLYAMRNGKLVTVVSITSAYPLAAMAIGYFVLGESVTPLQWLGVTLIVAGTVISNLS